MRSRRLVVLIAMLLVLGGAGAFAYMAWIRVQGSPQESASDYLNAWQRSDLNAMRRLVADPPEDFTDIHLGFAEELRVDRIELKPGTLKSTGEESAELPFTGVRRLREIGDWEFAGTLRLAVRDRVWRVLWAPETLHPALKDGGALDLEAIEVPGLELVTRSGAKMPHDSRAETYLEELSQEIGTVNTGWTIEVRTPGKGRARLIVFQPPPARSARTTLSRPVQAAAARALDDVTRPAAIVAVRASTGEILAVADRLGGKGAFTQLYPPGSTFKTVTAAALLSKGLTPDTSVPCPGVYTIPQAMTIQNQGKTDRGVITFAAAFAHSCNTTFLQQANSRLGTAGLEPVAKEWGFDGRALRTGVGGTCGHLEPAASVDFAATNALGQGTVQATPLCMALVAAAVDSGTWRSPRLITAKAARKLDGAPHADVALDPAVAQALRRMMLEVVASGTASESGLPEGVAGKTGTAEVDGQPDHAWFIGYHDDVAFSVFVKGGGSGGQVAVPIAARFLKGM